MVDQNIHRPDGGRSTRPVAVPTPRTGTCRNCGQPIRQVRVDEVILPPMVRTMQSATAMRDQLRAEVGELVWETSETRRYTCASASLYHEPVFVAGTRCPDDGKCHHFCRAACYRVGTCEPLSSPFFTGDDWPREIMEQHAALARAEQAARDLDQIIATLPDDLADTPLTALRTADKPTPRARLLRLAQDGSVPIADAYRLKSAGMVEAKGPYGTAPFTLTDLGVRVRGLLLIIHSVE